MHDLPNYSLLVVNQGERCLKTSPRNPPILAKKDLNRTTPGVTQATHPAVNLPSSILSSRIFCEYFSGNAKHTLGMLDINNSAKCLSRNLLNHVNHL
jgi:hypothetical protein